MNMKRKQKKNNKGFSLVELIVVIAIMAVLVGVLAPTLVRNVEKSREAKDLQNLDSVRGVVTTMVSDDKLYSSMIGKVFTIEGNTIKGGGYTDGGSELTAINTEFQDSIDKVTMTSTVGKSGTIVVNVATNGAVTVYITKASDKKTYLVGKSVDFITGSVPSGVTSEKETTTTPTT